MKAILGTMTIGESVFGDDAASLFEIFSAAGGEEVDAAYVYNGGECERIVGECLAACPTGRFRVATKANPRVTGRLDARAVTSQLDESLVRMGVGSVDVLYLHFPDRSTPVRSALEGCAALYAEGKFRELGVSNFPLSLVEEMLPICDELGCPRPTVFEGVYNALSRRAEAELFPALDRLSMRFYAYNPLAGGMLTGRYTDPSAQAEGGRFVKRPNYKGRYWKDSYFEAMRILSEACAEEGIPLAEASLRWLAHHSALSASRGDGVIVGASKASHLEQNLAALAAGPLPGGVLGAFDAAWGLTAGDAPEYWRFYDHGKAV